MNQTPHTPHRLVSNPEKRIEIEGGSYAEMVLCQSLHIENLRRAAQAINAINEGLHDEQLAAVQINLQAMVNAASGVLIEQVRLCTAQGLQFVLSGANGGICH